MARSLRSKRRQKNKQAMKARLKPKHDAQLAAIIQKCNAETCGDVMETTDVAVPDIIETNDDMVTDANPKTLTENKKIKIPKVDINKITQFMSQRKLRTFNAKLKTEKKRQKIGQKKKKSFKW